MMGRTHALSGLVTGVAAGQFVFHLDAAHLAVIAVVTAGAAEHYRHAWGGKVGLGFLLVLVLASALRALKIGGHFGDLLAIAAAAAMLASGFAVTAVWWAIAAGTATHLAGDMLTDQGIPIAWPFSRQHFRLLPEPLAFITGTRPERWFVAPMMVAALVWLVAVIEKVVPLSRLPLR